MLIPFLLENLTNWCLSLCHHNLLKVQFDLYAIVKAFKASLRTGCRIIGNLNNPYVSPTKTKKEITTIEKFFISKSTNSSIVKKWIQQYFKKKKKKTNSRINETNAFDTYYSLNIIPCSSDDSIWIIIFSDTLLRFFSSNRIKNKRKHGTNQFN